MGTPVSSTNKTDRHIIVEILLKVTLIIITLTMAFISRFIYSMYGRCAAVFNVNGGHTPLVIDLYKVAMKQFSLNIFEE